MTVSRSRGYNSEYDIVNKFNALEDWHARRLGGASSGLPDLMVTNNKLSKIFFIEVKSTGAANNLHVPQKQIERCFKLREMFSVYQTKEIILAFKFLIKYKNKGKEVRRQLKEYYYHYPRWLGIQKSVTCNYDGKIAVNHLDDTRTPDVTKWSEGPPILTNFTEIVNYMESSA